MDTFRLWKQRGIEMFVKEVAVQNQVGLHARPATFFIQKSNEYKSSIWVEKEERRVNAKSLLGVLSLGIVGGTSIVSLLTAPMNRPLSRVLSSLWSPALQSKTVCRCLPQTVRAALGARHADSHVCV